MFLRRTRRLNKHPVKRINSFLSINEAVDSEATGCVHKTFPTFSTHMIKGFKLIQAKLPKLKEVLVACRVEVDEIYKPA